MAREINGMIHPKSLMRKPLVHGSASRRPSMGTRPLAGLVVTLQHSSTDLAEWLTAQVTSPLERSDVPLSQR